MKESRKCFKTPLREKRQVEAAGCRITRHLRVATRDRNRWSCHRDLMLMGLATHHGSLAKQGPRQSPSDTFFPTNLPSWGQIAMVSDKLSASAVNGGEAASTRISIPGRRIMMKSSFLLARCLAVSCLLAPAAFAAEPENLVSNGGFEQGDKLPDWWNRHPREDTDGNRHLRDRLVFHSGDASALLWSVTPHRKGEAGIQWNRYGIAVEGGSVLAVSFYVKTEGVTDGLAPDATSTTRIGSTSASSRSADPTGPTSGHDVTRTVYVPPNAKTMGFALYGRDCGKTWYDDVSVTLDLEAAARRAAVRARFEDSHPMGDGPFRVVPAHSLQKIPRRPARGGGNDPRSGRAFRRARRERVVPARGDPRRQGAGGRGRRAGARSMGPGGKLDLQWNRVGYVKTAPPSYAVEYVGWWPDPLLPPGPFDLDADGRQPLWFRVDVPPDAVPGRYAGQVTIRHGDQADVDSGRVPRKRSFRLPRPGTLATPFGLYAFALARGYDAKAPYQRGHVARGVPAAGADSWPSTG